MSTDELFLNAGEFFQEDALTDGLELWEEDSARAAFSEIREYYDTTLVSQSAAGHPFGSLLTEAERRAVLEYLKSM